MTAGPVVMGLVSRARYYAGRVRDAGLSRYGCRKLRSLLIALSLGARLSAGAGVRTRARQDSLARLDELGAHLRAGLQQQARLVPIIVSRATGPCAARPERTMDRAGLRRDRDAGRRCAGRQDSVSRLSLAGPLFFVRRFRRRRQTLRRQGALGAQPSAAAGLARRGIFVRAGSARRPCARDSPRLSKTGSESNRPGLGVRTGPARWRSPFAASI